MAVTELAVASLIKAKGVVRSRGASNGVNKMHSDLFQSDVPARIEAQCWPAKTSVSNELFEIAACPPGTVGANDVIIANEKGVACCGQITGPGILYSDEFSGCIFFLFRDNYGSVYGVHSYRDSGKYADPMNHFRKLGATLIYVFNTGQNVTKGRLGVFGTVIVNVFQDRIVIDFLATQAGKILEVVDHKVIRDWRNAPAVAAPAIGGALPEFERGSGIQTPKQSGLKHKVAKFMLRYI